MHTFAVVTVSLRKEPEMPVVGSTIYFYKVENPFSLLLAS